MRVIVAVLVFVAMAGCAGVAAGFLGHGLHPASAWIALTIGVLAGLAAWWKTPRAEPLSWTVIEKILLIVFGLFAARAFFWVYFAKGDELSVLSPNNLGDISLHLSIINFLANGAPFWPAQPIFAAEHLQYPIGVDLLNSLLVLIGVDLPRSLVWVGLAAAAVTAGVLRRWGRSFALAGFLANGGLAGFVAVNAMFHTGHFALVDTQETVAWKSIPLALFVTQRSLLYAIPAGLLLLTSWRGRYFSADPARPEWRLPLALEWLLYGTMPLFHVHTFLALSFVLGCWLVLLRAKSWRTLAGFIASAVPPATLLLWLVTDHFSSHSMIHRQLGWEQNGAPFFRFWLLNFGILPFLVGALLWLAFRRRDLRTLAFAGPGVLLFLLCCYVMFAVWAWDNTKLMIWSYFLVLPFLWEALLARWPLWARAAACTALFFSGFYALVSGLDGSHQGYKVASVRELDSLAEPLRSIPIDATFAVFPTYNHPLLLHGRKVVEGYDGHLYSYGINYGETLAKLRDMFAGGSDWRELAADLHVDYLFWGPLEQAAYPDSSQPWKKTAEVVAHSGDWTIYRLQK